MVVPALTLGIRRELSRMVCSFHICPDGTNPVRGTGPCIAAAGVDLCISVGLFCISRITFCFVTTERKLTLVSGAFSLALRTNSRFAAEEDKHALVGILLSPGINLSI